MGLIPWKNKQPEVGRTEASRLATLRSEMDRLLDSFVREPLAGWEWPFAGGRGWSPALDVAENDQEVTVRAEIPGVDPKDLEISVAGGQLTLAGEKKESSEKSGKDFYHTETRYGSFRRSVPLPETVDPQQVDAEYANGVLTVRLKKSPSAAAKRIEVKVKE
jgi:HSP20 family protein